MQTSKSIHALTFKSDICGRMCKSKIRTRTTLEFNERNKDYLGSCTLVVRAQANEDIASSMDSTPEPMSKATLEYTLTIKKPLGLVLAENKSTKEVYVEEITPGGNADASGMICVGDVVSKTSAIVLKSGREGQYQQEGYGQRVYDNWETIEFDCAGQSFDTVMAAIGSNNERWGIKTVTLTLRRET